MRGLIDKRTVRVLNIAEALTFSSEPVMFEDFEKLNKCSQKTVYNDINYLVQRYNSLLEIEVRNISAFSRISSSDNFIRLRSDLYHFEPKLQLILNIYLNPTFDMCDHSLAMDYSESYLRKMLKEINAYLKRIGITIKYDTTDKRYLFLSRHKLVVEYFILELVQICDYHDNLFKALGKKNPHAFDTLVLPDYDYNQEEKLMAEILLIILANSLSEKEIQKYITYVHNLTDEFEKDLKPRLIEALKVALTSNSIHLEESCFNELVSLLIVSIQKTIVVPKKRFHSETRADFFERTLRARNPGKLSVYDDIISQLESILELSFTDFRSDLLFCLHQILNLTFVQEPYTIAVFSSLSNAHRNNLIFSLNKVFSHQRVVPYDENLRDTYDIIVGTSNNSEFVHNEDRFISISDIPTFLDHENIARKLFRSL